MKRELLFSITKKDFDIQTFCSGGKGGQHQNRCNSGVRIIHKDSGAKGESRDTRSQVQNKKLAFKRLVDSKKFKTWHRLEVAKRTGEIKDLNKIVNEMMNEKYLKIEYGYNKLNQKKRSCSQKL